MPDLFLALIPGCWQSSTWRDGMDERTPSSSSSSAQQQTG
eukprot:CAMPEP_0195098390 /NCGR_PEP_ID=MMETSP0448-20130528/57561_1 /TAXON_ID=66468 /ORGANISM="Heterocapsa triquestra, Strain CCMP 448" /LENGTH=39 /DNA_ID= /DNA_START= /DNA_END= /DNA_ORIENTATION=